MTRVIKIYEIIKFIIYKEVNYPAHLSAPADGVDIKNKFKFDVITRPKYDRRKLHLEKFEKGGFRRGQGGSTIPFSKLRKGDYVDARMGKKVCRGWVSGYEEYRGRIEADLIGTY